MNKKDVLATVGTRKITKDDVNAFLRSMDQETARNLDNPEGRRQVVRELVNRELFYLDAKGNKLDEDTEFLKQVEQAKEILLRQYAINKHVEDVTVGEKEVEQHYINNKDKFVDPPGIRVSHILVDNEFNAMKIVKELKEGLLFSEAAKKYSSCPSKNKGGDLGFLAEGQTVPEFENSAFQLDVGELSGPVKTRYGYHIIKVTEKKPKTQKSFDEMRNVLKQNLLIEKRKESYRKRADELRNEYIVKINK